MAEELHARFSGLINIEVANELPIFVLGAGAIGSNTVRQLVQSGFHNITVVDDDTVEDHNVLPQSYALGDIGTPKVEALAADLLLRLDVGIKIQNRRLMEPEELEQAIIISAVDSIGARRILWESYELSQNPKCFIDPRMGGLSGDIFFVPKSDPDHFVTYESTLWAEGEVSPLPCTERATPYCGNVMAGFITAYVVACLRGLAGQEFQHLNLRLFEPMAGVWPIKHELSQD